MAVTSPAVMPMLMEPKESMVPRKEIWMNIATTGMAARMQMYPLYRPAMVADSPAMTSTPVWVW